MLLGGLYDYIRCTVTIRYDYIEVTTMTSYMRSVHYQNIELSPTGSTIEYIVQHVTSPLFNKTKNEFNVILYNI